MPPRPWCSSLSWCCLLCSCARARRISFSPSTSKARATTRRSRSTTARGRRLTWRPAATTSRCTSTAAHGWPHDQPGGQVAAGDVFVIAQSTASAAILAQADQTNGSGWFNGDDAIVLRKGSTVIDVIGQIGVDPGTEWGRTLPARPTIRCAAYPIRARATRMARTPSTPSPQWDGFSNDVFDGLGVHTADCGPDAPPSISATVPANGSATFGTSADLTVTFSEAGRPHGLLVHVDVQRQWREERHCQRRTHDIHDQSGHRLRSS